MNNVRLSLYKSPCNGADNNNAPNRKYTII